MMLEMRMSIPGVQPIVLLLGTMGSASTGYFGAAAERRFDGMSRLIDQTGQARSQRSASRSPA
jgi:hypothetical protein